MWVAQDYGIAPITKDSELPVYNTATRATRRGRVVEIVGAYAQVNVGGYVVPVRVA